MVVALLSVLLLLQLVALWVGWRSHSRGPDLREITKLPGLVRDEFERSRREAAESARSQREELERRLDGIREGVTKSLADFRGELGAQLAAQATAMDTRVTEVREVLDRRLEALAQANEQKLDAVRETVGRSLTDYRSEFALLFKGHVDAVDTHLREFRKTTENRLQALQEANETKLTAVRETVASSLSAYRDEFATQFKGQAELVDRRLDGVRDGVEKRLMTLQQGNEEKLESVRASVSRALADYRDEFSNLFKAQADSVDRRLGQVREGVDQRLQALQLSNEQKLDEMRRTVDEKLQSTLEKRLGESFTLVSERLEKVHEGLGEMKNLAGNVLDLNRVLSNVKDRGMFGEVQLGNLLDQMLSASQYAVNVAVSSENPGQRVEYAIRLPNRDKPGESILLPIDAKFPLEDYRRLLAAQQIGDAEAREQAAKALLTTIVAEARRIRDKYIQPPATTDFAFMFLPTEGLYAEIASRPDLMDRLQEMRVIPAGPINLYALLDLVGMVHRFMAVRENASRVWDLLGAVKSEFAKFGDVVGSVKKKIDAASKEFDQVDVRTRAINRRLREVQELPAAAAAEVLPAQAGAE